MKRKGKTQLRIIIQCGNECTLPNGNTYVGIASDVSCAQRKKMLAGVAVTEVASTTLVKELISENAPCRENKSSKYHNLL